MLTKEPEMLQPDAFCENTMQQNTTAAAPDPTRGELTALPRPLAGFKGPLRGEKGEGNGGKGKRGKGMGEGKEQGGRGWRG